MANGYWQIIPPNVAENAPTGNFLAIDKVRGAGGAARMLEGQRKVGGGYGFQAEVLGPFADEIAGGTNALVDYVRSGFSVPFGDLYNEHRDITRAEQDAWREEHPVARVGANVLGAAATGARSVVGNALTAGQSVGQGARVGAAWGAGAGFGEGRGLTNRAETSVVGGAVGAAVGAAIPAVTEVVNRIARGLVNLRGLKGPAAQNRATRMIEEALQRDGYTLDDVANMATGGKPLSLADLGPNTRDVVAVAARTGGAGKQALDDFFEKRTLGQYGRISDDLAGGTGMKGQDFARTAEDIAGRRAAEATVGYHGPTGAYAQPAPALSDNVQSILATPDGRRAVSTATRFMENKRAPIRDDAGNFTVQMLDQIQRAMRDLSNRAKGARGTEQAANISTLRDQFLAEVPDELRAVMAAYRGKSELLDAMTAGRQFMKGDAEALGTALSKMTPQEADMFRLGVARELRGRMGQKIDSGDISGMFQNPQMRERLEAIFPSRRLFQDFLEKVRTERVMQETRNAILKGSQTASRQAASAEFGEGVLGEMANDVLSGGGNISATRMLMNAAVRGKDRMLEGVNSAVAENVANLATQPLPSAAASLSRQAASLPVPYRQAPPAMGAAGAATVGSILGQSRTVNSPAYWQIVPPQ